MLRMSGAALWTVGRSARRSSGCVQLSSSWRSFASSSDDPRGSRGDSESRNKKRDVKSILEAAARGEAGHDSGIPRLLARKRKSKAVHDDSLGGDAEKSPEEYPEATSDASPVLPRRSQSLRDIISKYVNAASPAAPQPTHKLPAAAAATLPLFDDKSSSESEAEDFDPDSHPDVTVDEDGIYVINYDTHDEFGYGDTDDDTEDLTDDDTGDLTEDSSDDHTDDGSEAHSDDNSQDHSDDGFEAHTEHDTYEEEEGQEEDQHEQHYYDDEHYDDEEQISHARDEQYDHEYNEGDEPIELVVRSRSDAGEIIVRDPEELYFNKSLLDFSDPFPDTPDYIANQVMDLDVHGPDFEDFLEAMIEHPTKYARIEQKIVHPDSKREPQPILPPDRLHPSLHFVQTHIAFIYVSGIPHPGGQFQNPLHRIRVAEYLANMFQLNLADVSPATMTSAFLGFASAKDAALAYHRVIANERAWRRTVHVSLYEPADDTNEQENDFAGSDATCLLQFTNVPPHILSSSSQSFLQNLLPPSSSDLIEQVANLNLTTEHVFVSSPSTVLLRLPSSDIANFMVESETLRSHWKEHMEQSGTMRFFAAKRERVFCGYSPNDDELKKKGTRLIVSGDVPTTDFFISHGGVLHITLNDNSTTEQEIANFFQPYCEDIRDVMGSVQFVTCMDGQPTGFAYVGFDRKDEMDAAVRAITSQPHLTSGDHTIHSILPVKEKSIVKGKKMAPRSRRTEEDILDNLNNWEKYVDPKDLQFLAEQGVQREVLDEAFTAVRYKNKSFGAIDQARNGEGLWPNEQPGDHYKKFVQLYIQQLKECILSSEEFEDLFKDGIADEIPE